MSAKNTSNLVAAAVFSIALRYAIVSPAFAADNKNLAEYVIEGMRSNRARLQTGQVDVLISLHRKTVKGPKAEELSNLSIALNSEKDYLRFDRTEVIHLNSQNLKVEARYIRKPDMAFFFGLENGNSSGTMTKLLPSEKPPGSVKPFDIQCLGLIDIRVISRFRSLSEVLDTLRANLRSCEAIEEKKYRLICVSPKSHVRTTIIVDESKGMTPIGFEASTEKYSNFVLIKGETLWEEKAAGVWVPTSSTMQGLDRIGSSATYKMNWKSVNLPLSQDIFDVAGLALPVGTAVVDRRLGDPIVESVVEEKPSIRKEANRWTAKSLLVLTLNVIVVLVLIGLLLRKNLLKRSST